jgi:hypothetical protein
VTLNPRLLDNLLEQDHALPCAHVRGGGWGWSLGSGLRAQGVGIRVFKCSKVSEV